MTALTAKQQTLYEFIARYVSERRQSPLIREIQDACQIVSYKSAVDRLNALERKGFIKRVPNKHRGIRLVKRSPIGDDVAPAARTLPMDA